MRTIVLVLGLVVAGAPPPTQPRPVVLKGAPGRWTVDGQAVADEGLQVRLRMVFEVRPDKRLHFAGDARGSYGTAGQTMGMAWAAGVEELVLLAEGAPLEDGLAVSLVALTGLEADVLLPVAEAWARGPEATDVEVTLRAPGVEPDGLARASSATHMLLRADVGRTYGEVLRALKLAKARGARRMSLAVQKPNGPGELKRRCAAGEPRDCGVLGELYTFGFGGVPKDPASGVKLIRQACGAGERKSCEMLALLLWDGEQVPMDRAEAGKLLTASCRAGLETSCALLKNAGLPVPKAP